MPYLHHPPRRNSRSTLYMYQMGELGEMKMNSSVQPAGPPAVSAPPFQLHSPSMTRSPLIGGAPKSPLTSRILTPLASPMKKAIASVHGFLEEVGQITRLDPHEAWLPITESRDGNAYYSAFHSLSSGIGIQALVLPLAFTTLGWIWGILCLSLAFGWQLYTLWLLIQLHESESGTRYSRYLRLSMAAFGEKLGKLLALFPTMYLSGGTCVTLVIIGGGTMKIFFEIICDSRSNCNVNPLTTLEWYIVFTCSAVVIAQLPNLNSIAGVSLVGAVSAITYCTVIWTASVAEDRPDWVSYDAAAAKVKHASPIARVFGVLNALGIIAFAFRGHNLVLEIQGTMPSSAKHPSRKPMWRGVKFAYFVIAMCLFPLAVGGYWAYGNLIKDGGMFEALYKYHGHDTSRILLGLTSLLIVLNCLSSFQIYAMPAFDNLEFRYISSRNKPCPWWLRSGFRAFFGCLVFFIAVALPFLPSLAGLIGGVALPVTFAYPCFMWIKIKQPKKHSAAWYLNWGLGCLGIVLSVLLVTGAVWSIVTMGIEIHFFKPRVYV